jgi:hypothetical protein
VDGGSMVTHKYRSQPSLALGYARPFPRSLCARLMRLRLCLCTAPLLGLPEMTTAAATSTKPGGYEAPPPDKKNLSVTLMWPGAKPAKANETWNIHVPKVGRVVLLLTSLFLPFGCACLSLKPRHSCGFCT